MEELEDTVMSFRHFLENVNRQRQEHFSPGDDDYLMCRGESTTLITQDDFEAEVLDWSLQYLLRIHCPSALASAVSRNVLLEMKTLNLDDILYIASAPGDPDVKAYDPVKLWTIVVSKVQEICQQWQEVTDLELSSLVSKKESVSVCAIKNGRRKMEDRHVVIQDLNILFGLQGHPPTSFYAVFDGHAGTDAACYSAIHLHYNIVHHPSYPHDIEKALKEGFKITDKDFISKSDREGLKSGSTALCCLVRDKQLYLAWLGDSQAILVRGGTPINIMSPHKPDRADERDRIENLGGVVLHFGTWRVNGTLAVSRAIGDAEYKPYVSSDPDVAVLNIDGTEDFVVLACDGLWDVLQANDVAELVYSHLAQHPDDLNGVSEKLVQVAKEQGSSDNITVITVFLRDVKDICAHAMLEKLNVTKSASNKENFILKSEGDAVTFETPVNGNPFVEVGYSSVAFEKFGDESLVATVTDLETSELPLDPLHGNIENQNFTPDYMSQWDTAGFQQQHKSEQAYPILAESGVGHYNQEIGATPLDYAYENPFAPPGANPVDSSELNAGFEGNFGYQQTLNFELSNAATGNYFQYRSQEVDVGTHHVFSRGEMGDTPTVSWSDGLGGLVDSSSNLAFEQQLLTDRTTVGNADLKGDVKPFESTLSPDAEPFVMGSKFSVPLHMENQDSARVIADLPSEIAVAETSSPNKFDNELLYQTVKQEERVPEIQSAPLVEQFDIAAGFGLKEAEPLFEASVEPSLKGSEKDGTREKVEEHLQVKFSEDELEMVHDAVTPQFLDTERPLHSNRVEMLHEVSEPLLKDTEQQVAASNITEMLHEVSEPLLKDTEQQVAASNVTEMFKDDSAPLLKDTEQRIHTDSKTELHLDVCASVKDTEQHVHADTETELHFDVGAPVKDTEQHGDADSETELHLDVCASVKDTEQHADTETELLLDVGAPVKDTKQHVDADSGTELLLDVGAPVKDTKQHVDADSGTELLLDVGASVKDTKQHVDADTETELHLDVGVSVQDAEHHEPASNVEEILHDASSPSFRNTEQQLVTDIATELHHDVSAPFRDVDKLTTADNATEMSHDVWAPFRDVDKRTTADNATEMPHDVWAPPKDTEQRVAADNLIEMLNVSATYVSDNELVKDFHEESAKFDQIVGISEVSKGETRLLAEFVSESREASLEVDTISRVSSVVQSKVEEIQISSSETIAPISLNSLSTSENFEAIHGYLEESVVRPDGIGSKVLISDTTVLSHAEPLSVEVIAPEQLLHPTDTVLVEPVAVDRIPDSAAIADDVEDDESEDGEGWKFYRAEATENSLPRELLTTSGYSADDSAQSVVKPAELSHDTEDKEAAVNGFGADATNKSSSLSEGDFQPLDISPEVAPPISTVIPLNEPVLDLVKVLEPAQSATVKEKSKAAPTKESAKPKAISKTATAKPAPSTKAGPHKATVPPKTTSAKPSTISRTNLDVTKKPLATKPTSSRMVGSVASRTAKAPDVAAKKDSETDVKKVSATSQPASAKVPSAHPRVPSTRAPVASAPASTRKPPAPSTAKVSKEQINVRSKPAVVSESKPKGGENARAPSTATGPKKSTAATVTARLSTAKSQSSTLVKKEVTKTQPGPKVSATTKMTVKQTKETVNKQISVSVQRTTAPIKSASTKIESIKTVTSPKSPSSANSSETQIKKDTPKQLTSTPKTKTSASRTSAASNSSHTSSVTNTSLSKTLVSSPKSAGKVALTSRTNGRPLKKSPAAAASTTTPTKKSVSKNKVEEVRNEKGILDASSKELEAHPDGIKNGDVEPEAQGQEREHVTNGLEEVSDICNQNAATNGQPKEHLQVDEGHLLV